MKTAIGYTVISICEVDSSLFVSERIGGFRCRKLHHYSVIQFLLSLSAYGELTEIKYANFGANACLCDIHWLDFMV